VTAQLAAAGIRALPVALPAAVAPLVRAGGTAGLLARSDAARIGGRVALRPALGLLVPRAIVLSWDPARRMTPQLVAFREAAIAAFATPEPAPLALTA
jgi:DNA-binding transcriptional LysR family regulator